MTVQTAAALVDSDGLVLLLLGVTALLAAAFLLLAIASTAQWAGRRWSNKR